MLNAVVAPATSSTEKSYNELCLYSEAQGGKLFFKPDGEGHSSSPISHLWTKPYHAKIRPVGNRV